MHVDNAGRFGRAVAAARRQWLDLPGVAGVGYGAKETAGRFTDEIAVVAYVGEKRPLSDLPEPERLPPEFGGYRTDVVQVGSRVERHRWPSVRDVRVRDGLVEWRSTVRGRGWVRTGSDAAAFGEHPGDGLRPPVRGRGEGPPGTWHAHRAGAEERYAELFAETEEGLLAWHPRIVRVPWWATDRLRKDPEPQLDVACGRDIVPVGEAMTDLRPQIDRDGMAQHLGAQPRVVLGYLFGSVAQGRADALSDVDVAVLLDESLDAEERLEETLRLMGELEPYTGGEVQVVLLNEAPPLLAYRVAEEGALLYARSEAERIAFQVRARKLYFDFRPRLAFHTRALLRDIEEVGLSGRRRRPGGALEAARRIHERLAGVHGRDV